MRRGILKKCLAVTMTMALAVTSLAGCGKKKTDEESLVGQATSGSKDYVFSAELLDIAEKESDFSRIVYAGDRVYASTYGSEGKLDIYSFNSDGSDIRHSSIPNNDNENYSYLTFDKDGNVYAVYYIYHWTDYEDEDGEMHTFEAEESEGETTDAENQEVSEDGDADASGADEASLEESIEETNGEDTTEDETDAGNEGMMTANESDEVYLVKYDFDGNQLYKVDLVPEFGDEDNYVSTNALVVTDEGEPILSLDTGIFKYDEGSSSFKTLIDMAASNESRYYSLYKGFGGKIFTSYYGDNGVCLCTFDTEKGTVGDPTSLVGGYMDCAFFGGSGYDLYMSKSDGIYGLDFAKETSTKILDFIDSDLEVTSSINLVAAISDTEFVALLPDADYNYYIARLTKVPADQVKDKKIITLGGYYIDYDIRKLAFEFNKNSDEYKIKFVDYSSYDDDAESYGQGIEKMNMDIVSGNVPDIMVLSDSMPVSSYINKGLFADIGSYLNNDPELSNVEFLSNIMDALRTGDKLYQLVPGFYIGTVAMKTRFTDGKDVLSIKDCKDLMNNMGVNAASAFGIMPRESFLTQGLYYSGDNYIDWADKQCHFDSESFIEFLEFAKEFPESYPDSVWEDYKDTLYLDNEALFNIVNISSFRSFSYIRDVQFGEEISFVGYPNDLGINNSVIMPYERLAISSQSQYKDAAWQFLRTFLSEEYQDKVEYCFPIRKSSFEKLGEESTHKQYYMDGDKKVEYDDTYYIGGQEVTANPLSKEDVVAISNFVKSLSLLSDNNTSVNNIIFEEASAFFSGQKSAKEVADIIQSRLSIYVNENS
ncbi:MAG: extracellular solute-binding protein [Butyrivibrio sp.]|nr:extracellular solute-binding protein [Butyrivibrio sp.]